MDLEDAGDRIGKQRGLIVMRGHDSVWLVLGTTVPFFFEVHGSFLYFERAVGRVLFLPLSYLWEGGLYEASFGFLHVFWDRCIFMGM